MQGMTLWSMLGLAGLSAFASAAADGHGPR
jgi:hypothetical protein